MKLKKVLISIIFFFLIIVFVYPQSEWCSMLLSKGNDYAIEETISKAFILNQQLGFCFVRDNSIKKSESCWIYTGTHLTRKKKANGRMLQQLGFYRSFPKQKVIYTRKFIKYCPYPAHCRTFIPPKYQIEKYENTNPVFYSKRWNLLGIPRKRTRQGNFIDIFQFSSGRFLKSIILKQHSLEFYELFFISAKRAFISRCAAGPACEGSIYDLEKNQELSYLKMGRKKDRLNLLSGLVHFYPNGEILAIDESANYVGYYNYNGHLKKGMELHGDIVDASKKTNAFYLTPQKIIIFLPGKYVGGYVIIDLKKIKIIKIFKAPICRRK